MVPTSPYVRLDLQIRVCCFLWIIHNLLKQGLTWSHLPHHPADCYPPHQWWRENLWCNHQRRAVKEDSIIWPQPSYSCFLVRQWLEMGECLRAVLTVNSSHQSRNGWSPTSFQHWNSQTTWPYLVKDGVEVQIAIGREKINAKSCLKSGDIELWQVKGIRWLRQHLRDALALQIFVRNHPVGKTEQVIVQICTLSSCPRGAMMQASPGPGTGIGKTAQGHDWAAGFSNGNSLRYTAWPTNNGSTRSKAEWLSIGI